MKKIVLAVLLIFPLIICSCSDTRTLKINSWELDINKLKSKELNVEDSSFADMTYSVSVKNEKLCVEKYIDAVVSIIATMRYGFFLGVDVGEYAGWVVFCPPQSDFNDCELVVPENCRGFAQIDDDKVLLLTGLAHLTTDKGKLYLLEYDKTTELYDFGSMPLTFTWDGETLYVITGDKLYSYKLGEEPVVLIENANFAQNLYPNSAVKIGNSIYCGCIGGIYEYCLDTGNEYWYPIE